MILGSFEPTGPLAGAVVKLWHAVDGLFIWEFFTTLDYEWSVIQGRRPYRWTIWIYSLTRVATLLAVILNIIGFDSTTPINCQAWVTFELAFAYVAFAGASLLIVFRIFAIWNRNKRIFVLAMSVWWINVGFLIHGIVRLRASWAPAQSTCAVLNLETSKTNIIVTLATDIILLLIMLIGLLRLRVQGAGMFGLGRLLWTQGIIWLLIATAAEVPPTVFICLNLNDPFNLMFQTPSLITMSIAATRMYRSLINFNSTDVSQEVRETCPTDLEGKRVSAAPIPLNRMRVSVHTDYERYPVSRYGSSITTDGPLRDKPYELSTDDDVERGTLTPEA